MDGQQRQRTGFCHRAILQELQVQGVPHGAPRAPAELHVTARHDGHPSLDWKDRSDNEAGFEVYRREPGTSTWRRVETLARNVSAYEDQTASPGKSYVYRVRSVNSRGESMFSNEVICGGWENI